MRKIVILSIDIYKAVLSPFLFMLFGGSKCRFVPTCSEYTKEAIKRFGVVKGLKLGLARLSKCQPFSRSEIYFPVVEK